MNGDHRSSRLEARGIALEERLFEKRSRYLVLFLTLNYKAQCRDDVTIDDLRRDRDRLLKNIESNPLLQGIQGYIWKIEEGGKAGLHIHLLLFYAGDHRADVYIAKRIGHYWETVITGGAGAYWNSNADKASFTERGLPVGVGQVNRKDKACRDAIRTIIRYMGKPDQRITERRPRTRTFGTSELR
ncbi:rolling circle replication-associated protein [Bordetella genomosp. 13]|uniref:Replication-associated protein ORF2/G2P domain-containing protein n=1 Tax=Bordetella genomosp. 13 TaxID=463040 RepID=A0A1W6ZD09_9BORD|nr:inovirus-type Gp2 protein [Bordetella genomosp. 13]ARP95251.1 hypothetical protein CAL15_13165 [Bordetella genomosp. 13]